MKKLIVFGLFVVFLDAKSQTDTIVRTCESPEGSTLLGYQDLVRVVKYYHNNNVGSQEDHTKALYIHDSVILFLESFFLYSANAKYHSVCFYFLDHNSRVSTHQRRNHQSLLYLVPVFDDATTGQKNKSEFSAFDRYRTNVASGFTKNRLNNSVQCFGTCDSSINTWIGNNPTPIIPYQRLHNAHQNVSGASEVFLLSPNRDHHLGKRTRYVNGQGREHFNNQTKRVYFHKNVILRLAQFIRDGSNLTDFPMIGIYFGSYNDWVVGSQAHPNQTTVNLVTMKKMDSGHLEPDVCSYIDFYNYQRSQNNLLFMKQTDAKLKFLAENHGELCPKICPPGGD